MALVEVDWTRGEEHLRVRHVLYGATAWQSNGIDIRRYAEGDEN